MFTPTEREAIRERLVSAACADADIKGLAHTGSYATGAMDRWSDVDLALAVRGDLNQVIERWTTFIHAELGAIHHWDLPVETSIYRVYLLRTGLELDVGFIPEGEFGPIGPAWRKVFGAEHSSEHRGSHRGDNLLGLCWHHVMHAAACIDRGKPWQAEWLISQARHHAIEIACRRHGVLVDFGKGTDALPTSATQPFEATLIANLAEGELRRALTATAEVVVTVCKQETPTLAEDLRAIFDDALGFGQ